MLMKKTKILWWWWRFVVVYCTTINCLLNASCMVSDKKRLTNTGSTQKPCYQLQTAATTQCGKQSCCMPPHCCCLCFLFPTVGQLGKLEFCGICKPVIFCNETPQKANTLQFVVAHFRIVSDAIGLRGIEGITKGIELCTRSLLCSSSSCCCYISCCYQLLSFTIKAISRHTQRSTHKHTRIHLHMYT